MKIIELEIYNISNCEYAHLNFLPSQQMSQVYLVHSTTKCEVISLAIQLICSTKFATVLDLHEIRDKIVDGKVNIIFTLSATQQNKEPDTNMPQEHSSDSDVPCTSKQAAERRERRLARRRNLECSECLIEVRACRNFAKDPDKIEYSVNNGPRMQCSALVFQLRFFTCTDIIFPRLVGLTYGEYCNGKWLDVMSTQSFKKAKHDNNLIIKFCNLYANAKLSQDHTLCQLTTSVLKARGSLDRARVEKLINIFNDIRWIFEYITCSEYTVLFLLPTFFGNLTEISGITTENVNFDLMKTLVKLKTSTEETVQFEWTLAEGHVQELFLVAVQLAFGYHCQQNIVYLHSFEKLKKHQAFEFLNFSLAHTESLNQNTFVKNYFQRILNICAKLNICCVVEYHGGLPFFPRYVYVIKCDSLDSSNKWTFFVKDFTSIQHQNLNIKGFLQDIEKSLKKN